MQLTKHTDFAFKALIYLGSMKQELATIQQIADSFQIPKSHLMKVINTLSNHGFVEAVRGKNGGIKLGLAADTISLKDVVVLMEKTLDPFDCVGQDCVILSRCKLKQLFQDAQTSYLHFLDGYHLADIIDKPTAKILHFQ